MHYKIAAYGLALTFTLAVPFACAADNGTETTMFSVSGFGTIGALHSTERNADYTYSTFQPKGAGATDSWSMAVDSRLGLQLNGNFSRQWSAVLQVISEQHYDGAFTPAVEWANIKYQATPDLSLRLGRIALPGTLSAEYRKVGYAIPWVRPPRDVYSLAAVTNNDGIDASYRLHFGSAINTVQAYYGRKDLKTTYQNGEPLLAREAVGVTDTVDIGATMLRVSYQQGRLTMPASKPFFDQLRRFGASGNELADKYDFENKRYRLLSLGANYDPGKWFLVGEWERIQTHSWSGDGTGWFVGGGLRLAQWTPYVMLSRSRLDSPASEVGLSTSRLPPAYAAVATQANAVLNSLLGNIIPEDRTLAIGTRWDFASNAALKLQLEHIDIGSGSGAGLRAQPGFVKGGQTNLVSVTVDFVF